jgi:hypothetical protein
VVLPLQARILGYLRIIAKHYRLFGGERQIRTVGALSHNPAKILGQTGWVFGLETSSTA